MNTKQATPSYYRTKSRIMNIMHALYSNSDIYPKKYILLYL